ncbi:hypothetical protein [Endozoicomonas arenosclerae]|uniref:hypothetical protein n=1 Tax=Endozoicomonas arenosclerae TaxID=1633495 RepID=UPI000A82D0A1|nr:hypothetical protein [Endozoicomonas arenosclerae]
MSDPQFEQHVHKELANINRQLADHSQMLGELKTGQNKLDSDVATLKEGQTRLDAEVREIRADLVLMDSKLDFITAFIKQQISQDNE